MTNATKLGAHVDQVGQILEVALPAGPGETRKVLARVLGRGCYGTVLLGERSARRPSPAPARAARCCSCWRRPAPSQLPFKQPFKRVPQARQTMAASAAARPPPPRPPRAPAAGFCSETYRPLAIKFFTRTASADGQEELEAALMVRAAKVFPELLGVMQAQGTVAALVFSFADGNTFEVEADKL